MLMTSALIRWQNAWGYNEATSEEDLLARLDGLVSAVIDSPLHIDGYVYTQTADIETEVSWGACTAMQAFGRIPVR